MKKIIFSFTLLFSFFLAQSQLTFNIGTVSGNKGDTVGLPVSVASGFNQIFAAQFSMSYDTNVLAILQPDSLAVIRTADFGTFYATHVGSANVKNGQLSFSWDAPGGQPKSIPNGNLLFTIRFKLIGKECDTSNIRITDTPTKNEYLDANLNDFPIVSNVGKVKINGTGCVNNPPPTDFELIASQETSPQGVVKCIKVTTKNFKNIQTAQFTMRWDKTVALFDAIPLGSGVLNPAPPATNFFLSSALADGSGVNIIWDAGAAPLDLPDGTVLFEVCLNPVGASGSMTAVSFDGSGVPVEFTDGQGNTVNPKFTSGKLTVTTAPAQSIKLYYRDTSFNQGTTFCIPIRVDNFKCVESFQFSTQFDTTKFKFDHIDYLPPLGSSNFFIVKDSIRVQWDAAAGPFELPNGGVLFSICFTVKAGVPCPFDTKLSFTNLHSSPIEFIDCNGVEFGITKVEPDFTINCNNPSVVTINLGTSTAVRCSGDCNGRLTGNSISGGVGPFQYFWKLYDIDIIVADSLNENDMCAGVYYLCVVDLGNANAEVCSDTIRVKSPDPLAVTAVITHVQAVNDGKIDITVTGGTIPYTFKYFRLPNKPNPPRTEEDPMNLPPADYELMITDANGCILMDTFTVNPRPLYFSDTITVHNKCFGECLGSITVFPAGGKPQYSYKWSNNTGTPPSMTAVADSLCAGTYSVTVTDNGATILIGSFTITEPADLNVRVLSITKSSGSNGAVFIDTVTGGTKAYSYEWKNAAGTKISSDKDLRNQPPGTYTLCVTDANGCRKIITAIIESVGGPPPVFSINLAIDPYLGNSPVSCRGKCDGKIVVTATATPQNSPFTYRWSHDTTLRTNIATGLCPGISYRVTVTDAAGNSSVSSSLLLPDAAQITVTPRKINCASSPTAGDGEYDAVTTGAILPISYRWCNGSNLKIATNLPAGPCSIEIKDANNCTVTEQFNVCDQTIDPAVPCYKGRLAISPNGDGLNETLEIACVLDVDNLLSIYDRWGNLVHSFVNYTNQWNGENQTGETLTEGTYMWVLKVTESGKEDAYHKGTVTIVR